MVPQLSDFIRWLKDAKNGGHKTNPNGADYLDRSSESGKYHFVILKNEPSEFLTELMFDNLCRRLDIRPGEFESWWRGESGMAEPVQAEIEG